MLKVFVAQVSPGRTPVCGWMSSAGVSAVGTMHTEFVRVWSRMLWYQDSGRCGCGFRGWSHSVTSSCRTQ